MTVTSVEPIDSVSEINPAILGLLRKHGGALPQPVFDTMSAYNGKSVVDLSVRAAEALYAETLPAAPGALRDDMAAACAQLAGFCTLNGWHELGQTDRGLKMAGACRRILGLGAQPEADDPVPLSYPGA